jgi:hypothetical protein
MRRGMWVKAPLMPSLKLYLIDPRGTDGVGGTWIAFEQTYKGGTPISSTPVVGDQVKSEKMGVFKPEWGYPWELWRVGG